MFAGHDSELNWSRGLAAIVRTTGNKDVHIILRGANSGPNYKSEYVKAAAAAAKKARPDSHPSIMIDCSRASSHRPLTLLPRLTVGPMYANRRELLEGPQ